MNIEKENTMRILQEKPLLVTKPFKCKLNMHKWTMWTDPKEARRGTYTHLEQFRTCVHCNKTEWNSLKAW